MGLKTGLSNDYVATKTATLGLDVYWLVFWDLVDTFLVTIWPSPTCSNIVDANKGELYSYTYIPM